MTVFSSPPPRIVAHRGASATHPENTLTAFRAAREAGAEAFELDVHRSADGEIIVHHDETLRRTTGTRGRIRDKTLAQLRELDAGYRFSLDGGRTFPFRGKDVSIPTLREVLEEFPDVPIIIEVKQVDPPLEEDLKQVLRDCEAEPRTLVFSLRQEPLDRYRTVAREQATGFGPEDVAEFLRRVNRGTWEGYRPPGVAFAVPTRWRGTKIVSAPFVEAAHEMGCEVFVWTVNREGEMERLLDLGVDGLISDVPGRLAAVIRHRREAAPAPADRAGGKR